LFATAKLVDLDGQSSVPYSFVCSPFRSKVKYAHAEKAVIVNRFVNPPDVDHSSRSLFPAITYGVDARPVGDPQTRDPARIPLDVLSKIQLLVSVPECISVDEKCVPCTLRLRATDLDSTECGRLQVTEFSMKLYQIEKYLFVLGLLYFSGLSCLTPSRPDPIPRTNTQRAILSRLNHLSPP
jgi:hypothetical protein